MSLYNDIATAWTVYEAPVALKHAEEALKQAKIEKARGILQEELELSKHELDIIRTAQSYVICIGGEFISKPGHNTSVLIAKLADMLGL